LNDGITKKLKDLWRRQAAYAASRQKIADAQMAIAENKRLGVSDPSRDAMLLADYQEALNHLLEIGEHMYRASLSEHRHPSVARPD
jgi:hypothetical protein